jgi:hypothetical protein
MWSMQEICGVCRDWVDYAVNVKITQRMYVKYSGNRWICREHVEYAGNI